MVFGLAGHSAILCPSFIVTKMEHSCRFISSKEQGMDGRCCKQIFLQIIHNKGPSLAIFYRKRQM